MMTQGPMLFCTIKTQKTNIPLYKLCLAGERRRHITALGKIIICDDEFRLVKEAAVLNCSVGSSINLTYVNYGRTQDYSEVCPHQGRSRTDCPAIAVVTERAEGFCQGQQTCQLTYDGLELWDTCDGTYKYFEVNYTCVDQGKDVYGDNWTASVWCESMWINNHMASKVRMKTFLPSETSIVAILKFGYI